MKASKNPYTERTGYISASQGENGWFCVFDRSKRDQKWSAGTATRKVILKLLAEEEARDFAPSKELTAGIIHAS